jgi:hypothetical protein
MRRVPGLATRHSQIPLRISVLATLVAATCLVACSRTADLGPVLTTSTNEPRGVLVVSGAQNIVISRPQGGEVEAQRHHVTLRNRGNASLYWMPQTDAAWLRFTPSFGQLSAGQSMELSIDVDAAKIEALPSGHHVAEVAIVDRSRGRAAVRLKAEIWSGVGLDRGTWLRNGSRKLLPLFVWGEEPTATWVQYFRGLGLNTLVGHAWEDSAENAASLLDHAAENEMLAVVRPWSEVARHPALLAFSLGEEIVSLEGQLEELREERGLARRVDERVPTFAPSRDAFRSEGTHPLRDWVDLVGLGFPAGPSTGPVEPDAARPSSRPARGVAPRPLWAMIDVEAAQQTEGVTVDRRLAHSVWSAIVRGATGIGYLLRPGESSTTPNLSSAAESALVELNGRLESVADVLLASAPSVALRVDGAGADNVSWTMRISGEETWVIAVNDAAQSEGDGENTRVRFSIAQAVGSVDVWGEERSLQPLTGSASGPGGGPDNGGFEDEFAPLQTHVYVLRP